VFQTNYLNKVVGHYSVSSDTRKVFYDNSFDNSFANIFRQFKESLPDICRTRHAVVDVKFAVIEAVAICVIYQYAFLMCYAVALVAEGVLLTYAAVQSGDLFCNLHSNLPPHFSQADPFSVYLLYHKVCELSSFNSLNFSAKGEKISDVSQYSIVKLHIDTLQLKTFMLY
jgi:hypothetical protein